jgi:ankyrin repeat protein
LDKTYEQTLLGIDKQKRKYAQRLFQCRSVSIRPLRVEELAEIFAVQPDVTKPPSFNEKLRPLDAEEAVLSACSSLVSVVNGEGGQIVQFSHFSVKEFFTSERLATAGERLSYYHILPERAHTILAHTSLSVLLRLDDKIDRNTMIRHFPLAPYAARHWVDHAKFKDVSSHIQEVMERLFGPAKPQFSAWVWLYDIDHDWIKPMSTIHPMRPEAVPLYYASLCGFHGLVERLIVAHSQDVNSKGGSHTTPLHAASVKGHADVVSLLLRNGANPNSLDDRGRAPLHRVSHGGQLIVVQSSLEIARLLVNSGADVSVTDNGGWTPLHVAAKRGYRDVVQLLLGSGASLDVRNEKQETPLYLACEYGKFDVARFLIDRGSDINSREIHGFIPLHSASQFGHLDIVRLLLDCGSDVNVGDNQSSTALHFGSQHGRLDVARHLIDRGADVNAPDVYHWTPIHCASRDGQLDSVKLLIDHGANIDSQTIKQETPLALSVKYLQIARFLIDSGAAVSPRDVAGWTPFHTASFNGYLDVAKFLL